ncbi:MAG TPA: glycosyltransferase family 1 protein [Thiobacillus sp.]|nr:glycosyltransferase family 1 protein [Thiobacillus sp.]
MHIGFDISQTGSGKAGCGYFAHALIKAMLELAPEHRYSLYPSFGDFYLDALMPFLNPYAGGHVHYGPRHLSRETARVFWNGPAVESVLNRPDIVHANNFWCPTQLASSRLIYTFYDMSFAVEPAWTTEANRVGCFDGVFRSAIAADWVVAISEASRVHYLNMFPHFPADRIRVIYPCSRFADSSAVGKRPKALDDVPVGRYWLNVGTIEPRKNQRRLVEAYARYLAQGGAPMPLVLAGGKGWLMEDFKKHLVELGVEAHVMMIGYVSDDELIWLYRNCCANLYPSLFEGFGLPVLEGMQFGAATLASNATSIPEVAGDAAILIAPEDTEGWAQAMLRLAGNRLERDRLRDAAIKQAARFSWEDSANQLLKLYEVAVASPKRSGLGQARCPNETTMNITKGASDK